MIKILYLFLSLITINSIILIHEIGHFLFSKLFGIKVEKFSIGFGKEIFAFNINETRFCICMFFFGGYVKFFGENLLFENIKTEPETKTKILENENNKNQNDKFFKNLENSLDSKNFPNFENNKNLKFNKNVLESKNINRNISNFNQGLNFFEASFFKKFFIIFMGPCMNFLFASFLIFNINFFYGEKSYDFDNLIVKKVIKNDIDIISGDKILEIDNITVHSWVEFLEIIEKIKEEKLNKNKYIPIKIERNFGNIKKEKILHIDFSKSKKIGISPISNYKRHENFSKTILSSYEQIKFLIKDFFIFKILKSKFINNNEKIKIKDFSGPIGIFREINKTFSSDLYEFFMFLAILNLNISFFNLLPIMPLDGGYIIVIFLQSCFKKNLKKANKIIFYFSSIMIICLFLFEISITIKDLFFK